MYIDCIVLAAGNDEYCTDAWEKDGAEKDEVGAVAPVKKMPKDLQQTENYMTFQLVQNILTK